MRLRNKAWIAAVLLLAGCAGTSHRLVADTPVKIGKPYQVRGSWYVPADDRAYDQIGLASWYGRQSGSGTTANGERYDPKRIGAAHKTLPLPCYVEVTALDSGRRIIVRVNDRGPFAANRIIDLSYGAAELLGIARQGVARVRVRRVFPDEATRRTLRSGRPGAPLPSIPPARAAAEMLAPVAGDGYQEATRSIPQRIPATP